MIITQKDMDKLEKYLTITGEVEIGNKTNVELEAPCFINKGVTLNVKKVGAFSYFSADCLINKCESIGRFAVINKGVYIGLANRSTKSLSMSPVFDLMSSEWAENFHDITKEERKENHRKQRILELRKKETVVIGNDVWIGAGAQVLLGVEIGDGAVVGAGSIVTKKVDPYTIVAGNPARVIGYRFEKDIIEELLKLKWWTYGPNILKGVDITDTASINVVKDRIKNGFSKYEANKILFSKNLYEKVLIERD